MLVGYCIQSRPARVLLKLAPTGYGVARIRSVAKAGVIISFRSVSNNRAGLYRDPKQKVFIVKKKRSDLKAKKTRYYNH